MKRSALVLAILILSLSSSILSQASREAAEITLKGIKYYEAGELDLALESFTRAIELSSKPKKLNVIRGNSLLPSEEEALRDRITFHDPLAAVAYLNRGHVHFARAKMDLAIADYTSSIKLKPANADAYGYRSTAHLVSRQIPKAIDDARKAIKIEPKYSRGHIALAMAFIESRRIKEASDALNRAAELDPENAEVRFRRGDLNRLSGDPVQALADYDAATKLDAELPSPYTGRGAIRFDQGQYEEAIEQYSIALKLDPRLLQARRLRAYAYLAVGRDSDAERDLARVLAVNPSFLAEIETAKADILRKRKPLN